MRVETHNLIDVSNPSQMHLKAHGILRVRDGPRHVSERLVADAGMLQLLKWLDVQVNIQGTHEVKVLFTKKGSSVKEM